jgi:ATP-binding protein involved in chromosome partitioning
LSVPYLGNIPIDPNVCDNSDSGTPFIAANPNQPTAKAFTEIVKKTEQFLEKASQDKK